MKERNYNYDIMRIVACLLIICMHAPMPSDSANSIFLNITGYFPAAGLCMFFVLSGALLLPVKMDTFMFLKKRMGKVVMPMLCFTALYVALKYFSGDEVDLVHIICSVPFSTQGHGVLWFMYTLIGLYLLSPIISKWLQRSSKFEVEFYLGLWLISQCYPIVSLFAEVNTSNTGILYYFSGYAGYFLLGYYLKTYPNAITWKKLSVPLLLAIVAPVAFKVLRIQVDFYSMFWYTSVFVTILTVAMYKFFMICPLKFTEGSFLQKIVTTASSLCFGIYLVHIAVMRSWLWQEDWIMSISNYYLQYVAIVVLTFAISFIITYIISLLPFGDLIIGYKQNRT